jgi:hypothetical protein
MQHTKSWLKSATIQKAFVGLLATLITLGVEVADTKKVDSKVLVAAFTAIYAFTGVVNGRANASEPIHTPPIFQGANAPTIDQKLEAMIEASQSVVVDSPDESQSNGEVYTHIPDPKYFLKFKQDSVLKTSLSDSSTLPESELVRVSKEEEVGISAYQKTVQNHITVTLDQGGKYFAFIPHFDLSKSTGQTISLIDQVSPPSLSTPTQVPTKKTPVEIPGYGVLYLEDPVVPNGHIYWSEIMRNGERPLANSNQVRWTQDLVKQLEIVRAHFGGRPLIITSAYRPPHINAAVGGASNSQHLYSESAAVDFYIKDVSLSAIYNYLDPIWTGGLAISHRDGFIHIDGRGYRDRWVYN